MTFYNHIESVRGLAIDLTNGRKWRGASDKAAVFDALDAARREYMRLSDENAKLRELARNLRRVIPADVVGVVIGANTDHPTYYKFDEAFRELGIEVEP